MANIMIRVTGMTPTGSNAVEVGFDVLPEGSSTVFQGTSGEPFVGDPAGINAGIIGIAKFLAGQRGFPVSDTDSVLLIGGFVVPQIAATEQAAHVVMRGAAVDSAFVGGDAATAARARADALAESTDGLAQDEAIKMAPWIATVPVNPN